MEHFIRELIGTMLVGSFSVGTDHDDVISDPGRFVII